MMDNASDGVDESALTTVPRVTGAGDGSEDQSRETYNDAQMAGNRTESMTRSSAVIGSQMRISVEAQPLTEKNMLDPPMEENLKGDLITFATFVLMGVAVLGFFQSLVVLVPDILQHVYPWERRGDTVFPLYITAATCVTTAFIVFRVPVSYVTLIRIGLSAYSTTLLLLAVGCWTFSEAYEGAVLFNILATIGGVCNGITQSSMFKLAATLSSRYVGALCAGTGSSGLIYFISWQIWTRVVFRPVDTKSIRRAIWCHSAVVLIMYILVLLLLVRLVRRFRPVRLLGSKAVAVKSKPDNEELTEKPFVVPELESQTQHTESTLVREKQQLSSSDACLNAYTDHALERGSEHGGVKQASVTSTNNRENKRRVLKPSLWSTFTLAAEQIMNVGVTLFITLSIFPIISPVGMPSDGMDYIYVGAFLLGDFIGPYIPNLREHVPFVAPSPSKVKFAVFSRVLFYPLFIIPRAIPQSGAGVWLSHTAVRIIISFLFTLTGGWLQSLANICVPEVVCRARKKNGGPIDEEEVGRASTMSLVCLLISSAVGSWVSHIVNGLLPKTPR